MRIKDKLFFNKADLIEHGPINIVILGDSVSHGAFSDYINYDKVYWNLLRQKMNAFRDYTPINMICASIGGTRASCALQRLDKQVLIHEPDLVIVCFGLNDVNGTLEEYLDPLKQIFARCKEAGSEVIFLTPNMLCTYVAPEPSGRYRTYAGKCADMQNSGRMDQYIQAAVSLAQQMEVAVCDCYSKWKELAKTEDITLMLSNRINHPTEEMHQLFADSLYEMIMADSVNTAEAESTMYSEQ